MYDNNDDDDSSEDNREAGKCRQLYMRLTRRHVICICLIYIISIILLNQLALFNYNRYLPLDPELTRVTCTNVYIKSETDIGIGEIRYSGIVVNDNVRLYITSVTRSVECRFTNDGDPRVLNLYYRDDYLNISHMDVDDIIEKLRLEYPVGMGFTAYYYDGCIDRLNDHFDVNCLARKPLDPDGYVNYIDYIALKLLVCLVVSVFLSIYVVILYRFKDCHSFYRKMKNII